jgi:hypothetical protein
LSVQQQAFMRRFQWHLRRSGATVSSYLLGTRAALVLIGFTCRHILRRPIISVFLLYPARKEYADALAYQWHQRRFSWHPGLVGLYRQGGRYGLIFGIPNLEDQIRGENSAPHLAHLMQRMETARSRVGASRKIFAGILPSAFVRNGIENEHLAEQRHLTARAVLQALDKVVAQHGLSEGVPILILGGRGYIASEVLQLAGSRNVTSLDIGELDTFRRFADSHGGRPAVVINLTKSGALSEYAKDFWPGVIVLNEVYPEPSLDELGALEARGAVCYHIVGVEGTAWPPFPRAYRGGIPCCASLPISSGDPIPVLVSRLSADGSLQPL